MFYLLLYSIVLRTLLLSPIKIKVFVCESIQFYVINLTSVSPGKQWLSCCIQTRLQVQNSLQNSLLHAAVHQLKVKVPLNIYYQCFHSLVLHTCKQLFKLFNSSWTFMNQFQMLMLVVVILCFKQLSTVVCWLCVGRCLRKGTQSNYKLL